MPLRQAVLAALGSVLLVLILAAPLRATCTPRDFLALELPRSVADPVAAALELAYPGLAVRAGEVLLENGQRLPLGRDRGVSPAERLASAQIAEQFVQIYPLDFDLRSRRQPWFDPGRARNEAFFRALWFDSEAAARASLTHVSYRGGDVTARFSVTTRHCVAAQLQAALDEVAAQGPAMDRFFQQIGGSFNWRRISGTDRLSAHSFGIAVDFNTRLGGYWQWAGQRAGQVGDYVNHYPEALVQAMERRGFIWGGKWHHYDGMHFEYRPELILHARMAERRR